MTTPATPRELTDAEYIMGMAQSLQFLHVPEMQEHHQRLLAISSKLSRAEAEHDEHLKEAVRIYRKTDERNPLVAAIRYFRNATGASLKMAKETIETALAASPEPQATVSVSTPDGMRELPTAHQWAHDLAEANEPNERIWFAASLLRQLVDEYRACEAQHTEDARVFDALLLLRDEVVFTRAGLPDEDAMRRAIDTANAAIAARSTGGGNG